MTPVQREKRIVAIDVGNTQVGIGLFVRGRLRHTWRMDTERAGTSARYRRRVRRLFEMQRQEPRGVEGVAICSVVPALTEVFLEVAQSCFGKQALNLEPQRQTLIPVAYRPPSDVGADRIANAIGARVLYGVPLIIVDLGTATTVDAVSEEGVYLGGAITPGLETSVAGLIAAAAKLRPVTLRPPGPVIGRTTEEALLAGAIYGHAAEVQGLVRRMRKELGKSATVVGTGGLVSLLAPYLDVLHHVRPHLTLEGLYHFWRQSTEEGRRGPRA